MSALPPCIFVFVLFFVFFCIENISFLYINTYGQIHTCVYSHFPFISFHFIFYFFAESKCTEVYTNAAEILFILFISLCFFSIFISFHCMCYVSMFAAFRVRSGKGDQERERDRLSENI